MTFGVSIVETCVLIRCSTIPHYDRNCLLAGPNIIFIVSRSGCCLDYLHQCTAAAGIIDAARRRQLVEQAEGGNRSFKVEIPQRAFAAASPEFRQCLDMSPDSLTVALDLGPLIPWYVMFVPDWLVHVLRHKDWYDFAPIDASVEVFNKWYWIYCYAAMRRLGMTEPAIQLEAFCQRLIRDHDAVRYHNDYTRLLRVIQPSDPLVNGLARETAQQLIAGNALLSEIECSQLASLYPLFGEAVDHLAQQAKSCGTGLTAEDHAMEL